MKMKRFLHVCLAAALAASCCACSQETETAAQAAEKMRSALLESPCGHVQMVMYITMTLDAGEPDAIEMSVSTVSDIKITQDPVSGYTAVTADVDYGGEKSRTFTENYSVVEGGALVSYIHSNGAWLIMSAGQTPEELSSSASSVMVDASNAVIDGTVTEYQGKEAMCLTTCLSGEALRPVLGGLLESIGQQGAALADAVETAGDLDCSALSCDARIYLDKETYLPLAEEMTFSGMSAALAPLSEQMDMKADITGCTATVAFLSYEAQEEIALPTGAKEKAEKWMRLLSGEPDNDDGSFTIREGAVLIDVETPEGFELTDKGYDHVYFKRDDNREVRYTVVYGTAEYLVSQIDRQLAGYGDLPKEISREQTELAGDALSFDVDIVGVAWQSYEEGLMYAWADLGGDGEGNYFVFIEVRDGYNDGLGNMKNADVTPEEFMAYLNGAVPAS